MDNRSRSALSASLLALLVLTGVVLWNPTSGEQVNPTPHVKSAADEQGLDDLNDSPKNITNSLGMKFVPVRMTLPDKPERTVYVQQSEVTYEQYRQFKVATGLATTPAEHLPTDQPLAPHDFDYWTDAETFINRLNHWDKHLSYRMLTETEWEFACTGRVGGEPIIRVVCQNSGPVNRQIRQSEPNQFGLHDMLGVYGEYCADRFNTANDPIIDLQSEGPNAKVVRGMRQSDRFPGCFRYSSDFRFPVSPYGQTPHLVIGIRLVAIPRK